MKKGTSSSMCLVNRIASFILQLNTSQRQQHHCATRSPEPDSKDIIPASDKIKAVKHTESETKRSNKIQTGNRCSYFSGLFQRGIQTVFLLLAFAFSTNVWAMSVSPSPSAGDYTVSTVAGVGGSSFFTLQEKVGTGSWTTVYVPSITYSVPFSGKPVGSYQYRVISIFGTLGPVSVEVIHVNTAPVATDDSATTNEDTTTTIAVLSNDTDVDADPLTISAVTQGTNGSVTFTGSDVSYTPNNNFNGSDSFTYSISDGNGGTDTATVSLTINAVNDNPVATDDRVITNEDIATTIAVLANDTDIEGDTLIISAVTQGTNGSVSYNSTNLTYTPNTAYAGTDSFSYTIDDGNGGSATATVTVMIINTGGSGSGGTGSLSTVGFTPGEFSVDASGSANYTVPISVPPGTAGMQPSLSLSYNSRSGNGVLGIGWTLGGLSVITRCPTSKVIDGFIDAIDFDDNDRFCIDGQRLISISGIYGEDLTEYRTEIDGFTKVISYDTDTTNNGPEYFTVWTKSGQILEYGVTDDSRIEAEGKTDVRLWAVNRIEDTVGNYLSVSYLENNTNGEYQPDRIDYTGNDSASLAPYASVQFIYETRTDITPMYFAGSLVKNTQRLTNIYTYADTALVRDYQLDYDNNGAAGASRLTQIAECDADANCLSPTTFTWPETGDGEVLNTQIDSRNWSDFRFYTADWNGDGQTDLLRQRLWKPVYNLDEVFMDSADDEGLMQSTGYSIDGIHFVSENEYTYGKGEILTGDWNGDGLVDIATPDIFANQDPGCLYFSICDNYNFYQSTGTSMVFTHTMALVYQNEGIDEIPVNRRFITGDWNGDGRTDLIIQHGRSDYGGSWLLDLMIASDINGSDAPGRLYLSDANGELQISFVLPDSWDNVNNTLLTGDWNGDGLTDIALIAKNTGTSTFYHSTGTDMVPTGFAPTDWGGKTVIVGDWNGDGNSDVLVQDEAAEVSTLYHSDGQGYMVTTGYSATDWGDVSLLAGDWNGDGRTDLGLLGKNAGDTSYFYRSTGSAMEQMAFTTTAWGGEHPFYAGDWNGDGLIDLWRSHKETGNNTYQYTTSSDYDYITAITDGLGNETQIVYTPITDDSVYTKGSSASYPEVDIQGPVYVVSSVTVDDGIGGTRDTHYTYAGAKSSVDGRGFLGFAEMSATDVSTGIKTTTSYNQTHPFIGLVDRTEQRLADNTLIGEVDSVFAYIQTHTGIEVDASHPGVLFPYASSVVKKDYELDGGLVTTTTTDNVYDSYGNPTSITVDVTDGTDTFTTAITNTYTNDTTNWFLGRLTRAEVTQTIPGTPSPVSETRVSSFSYDATTGLLTQEVIEPDTAALSLTTDYLYDAFGNKTSVTVSGGSGATAIASRTTSTIYDARGQFATSTTNALGHSESRTYDDRFGVMLSLTGPNVLTTNWTYDSFGRQLQETRADGTITTVTREWCDGFQGETGNTNCPQDGALALTTETDGAPISIAFSDALGRVIQTETEGFDGTAILVDTVYDALGRIDAKSRPYFIGTLAIDIEWHSFTYDVVGRLLTETAPDASVTTSVYAGLSTSVTNDKNQTNKRINNARGELIQVVDAELNLTDYSYDAFGNLIEVEDALNNSTTNTYDIRGRKISMTDPDMGYWTYDYNVLGELLSQTDAIDNAGGTGPTVTMTYDLLGRLISRVETEGTSTWTYDTTSTYATGQAAHSIGKLISVSGAEGKDESYTFDSLGRLVSTTTTIDSTNYTTEQNYDLDGRLDTVTYPDSYHHSTGLEISNVYNAQGYLEKVTDGTTVYWTANTQNAEGQLTQYTFGNGVDTEQVYDVKTGRVTNIATGTLGNNSIQDLTFTFDTLGNLTQRQDYNQGTPNLSEDFVYDVLNRMTSSTLDDGTTITTKNYSYNAIGNLLSKTGIGSYTYGTTAGPHAVTSVLDTNSNIHDFIYDANGNQTSGYNFTALQIRSQTWTSYNKVKAITQGTTTLDFAYGADRARFKQVNSNGKTTIYLGSLYEKETEGGLTTHVHYIQVGGTTVAMYKSKSDNSEETRYLHRDHIGSLTAITDETAQIVEQLSYDPHGKRRQMTWEDAIAQVFAQETHHSFTDHEYLDDVGLVHMGGRVYDPDLGRFLSADPTVQYPKQPQNFNRYTYVNNNPLSYTDPSGFGFFSSLWKAFTAPFRAVAKVVSKAFSFIKDNIQTIAAIAVAAVVGPYCAPCAGFAAGMISSGGDLKAGIIGAVTAGAFDYIGGIEGIGFIEKTLAHGVVGGVANEIGGGDFLSGFLSAGVVGAAGASSLLKNISSNAGKLIASSVMGGVAAELGGGKFKNGAITGAFAYTFASAVSAARDTSRFSIGDKDFVIKGGTTEQQLQVQAELGGVFGTPRGAQMLVELESRRFLGIFGTDFTIDLTVTNNAYAYAPGDAIYVDPVFHPSILTSSGMIPATTRRIMAHELGHATFGTLDDGYLRMNNVNQNENPVMNSLGQPSRLRY